MKFFKLKKRREFFLDAKFFLLSVIHTFAFRAVRTISAAVTASRLARRKISVNALDAVSKAAGNAYAQNYRRNHLNQLLFKAK